MDEPQKMQLEIPHSRADEIISLVTLTVWAGATYYALDPEGFQRNWDRVRSVWTKLRHRVSVWQAREAIRSLPTTHITGITDAEAR